MERFWDIMTEFLLSQHDWAAIGILSLISFFIFLFYKAQKNKELNWTDLITAKDSSSVSLTKVLQLVGGVVGTWIMIKTTLQGKITWDLFAIYLTYAASVDGFSKFISQSVSKSNIEKSQPANDRT